MTMFLRRFCFFTITIALVHFVLESAYTVAFGQTWAGLLPDYVAVALLCWTAWLCLRDERAKGMLCGAWGFTLCLHYRTWAWRYDAVQDGTATPLIENTMYVLAYTMPLSIVSFIICLYLCLPRDKR